MHLCTRRTRRAHGSRLLCWRALAPCNAIARTIAISNGLHSNASQRRCMSPAAFAMATDCPATAAFFLGHNVINNKQTKLLSAFGIARANFTNPDLCGKLLLCQDVAAPYHTRDICGLANPSFVETVPACVSRESSWVRTVRPNHTQLILSPSNTSTPLINTRRCPKMPSTRTPRQKRTPPNKSVQPRKRGPTNQITRNTSTLQRRKSLRTAM